jgi:hypothetical protein
MTCGIRRNLRRFFRADLCPSPAMLNGRCPKPAVGCLEVLGWITREPLIVEMEMRTTPLFVLASNTMDVMRRRSSTNRARRRNGKTTSSARIFHARTSYS